MRVALSLLTIGLVLVCSCPTPAANHTAPAAVIPARGTVVDAPKRPLVGMALELRSTDGKTGRPRRHRPARLVCLAQGRSRRLRAFRQRRGHQAACRCDGVGAAARRAGYRGAQQGAQRALAPDQQHTVYRFSDKHGDQLPRVRRASATPCAQHKVRMLEFYRLARAQEQRQAPFKVNLGRLGFLRRKLLMAEAHGWSCG